jgi:hypothetical protein
VMTRNRKLATLDLSASRSERTRASQKLGGITLWSKSDESLARSASYVREEIELVASEHLCVTKNVLRKLVRTKIAPREVEDKVFSAILGSAMRLGAIDSIVCASKNDRPYRALVHSSKLADFDDALAAAVKALQDDGTLAVADLEARLFGTRRYNTWSASSSVLAHLSYRGFSAIDDIGNAVLVDRLK